MRGCGDCLVGVFNCLLCGLEFFLCFGYLFYFSVDGVFGVIDGSLNLSYSGLYGVFYVINLLLGIGDCFIDSGSELVG